MKRSVLRAAVSAALSQTGAALVSTGAFIAAPAALPAAQAASGNADAASDPMLYWYEGGVRRPLRIDPAHVARFDAAGPRRAADVIAPADLARKDAGGVDAASPVLRDASGSTRALPGGVIVTLPADTTEDDARARLQALGVQPVRPIGAGARTWLVAAEPGLASLRLANRLHETGAVSAQPNWWQPRATK